MKKHILILLLLPFLLLISHRNWILPGLDFDSLTSWGLYHIYDIRMPFTTLHSSHYYGRLGAILPGFICFRYLPAHIAVYVLNFGYWYVTVFSMYFTVRLLFGKNCALFTAILTGCYPCLLAAFSSGFNDGPAICYLSMALYLLALSSKRQRKAIWLIASGMAIAGAVYSNFFIINLIPVYLAYYFIIDRKRFILNCLLISFGFLLLTCIFGLINLYYGGYFIFFHSTITASIHYLHRLPTLNAFHNPLYITISHVRHAILPTIVFICSLLLLLFKRKNNGLQIIYIFTAIIYIAYEVKGSISPLYSMQYAGFLLPIMFLTIAGQINYISSRFNKYPEIILCVLFSFTFLYSYLPDTLGKQLTKEQFMAIENGFNTIQNTKEYIAQARQRFWIQNDSIQSPVYRSLAAVLGGYFDLFKWDNEEFQQMEDNYKLNTLDKEHGRPVEGEIIAVITDKLPNPDDIDKKLNTIGLASEFLKIEYINYGKITYIINFIKIIKKERLNEISNV